MDLGETREIRTTVSVFCHCHHHHHYHPNQPRLQPQQCRYSYCTVKETSSDALSLQTRFLFRNNLTHGGSVLPTVPCRTGVNEATRLCRNTGPQGSPGRAALLSLLRMVAFLHLKHDLESEGLCRFEDTEAPTSYSEAASMLRIEISAGIGIERNGGPGRAQGKGTAFWELLGTWQPRISMRIRDSELL